MKLRSTKGFSLVELIIVIAILGIIAVVAVPNLTAVLNNSKANTDKSTAAEIGGAAEISLAEGVAGAATSTIGADWAEYSSVIGSQYISAGYVPKGMASAKYYVKKVTIDNAEHIVVGISTDTTTIDIPNSAYAYETEGIAHVSGFSDLATAITELP